LSEAYERTGIPISRTLHVQVPIDAAELKKLLIIQFNGGSGMNHDRLFEHPRACHEGKVSEEVGFRQLMPRGGISDMTNIQETSEAAAE
jgi:hypothetical protein